MVKQIKFNKNILIWVIGILFIMSIIPGEGNKASDQQAIVTTDYTCTVEEDCPTCIGGGLIKFNETEPSFFGELSFADCISNRCQLSDSCLIWDCGDAGRVNETGGADLPCESIKQTLLDNTLGRINQSPGIIFAALIFIVAFFML